MEEKRKRRARVPFAEKLERLDAQIAAAQDHLAGLKEKRGDLIAKHREAAEAMLAETKDAT